MTAAEKLRDDLYALADLTIDNATQLLRVSPKNALLGGMRDVLTGMAITVDKVAHVEQMIDQFGLSDHADDDLREVRPGDRLGKYIVTSIDFGNGTVTTGKPA